MTTASTQRQCLYGGASFFSSLPERLPLDRYHPVVFSYEVLAGATNQEKVGVGEEENLGRDRQSDIICDADIHIDMRLKNGTGHMRRRIQR